MRCCKKSSPLVSCRPSRPSWWSVIDPNPAPIELTINPRLVEAQNPKPGHTVAHVSSPQEWVTKDGRTVSGGTGFVSHFEPRERRAVRAVSDARLVLVLAPWPGMGHPSRPR